MFPWTNFSPHLVAKSATNSQTRRSPFRPDLLYVSTAAIELLLKFMPITSIKYHHMATLVWGSDQTICTAWLVHILILIRLSPSLSCSWIVCSEGLQLSWRAPSLHAKGPKFNRSTSSEKDEVVQTTGDIYHIIAMGACIRMFPMGISFWSIAGTKLGWDHDMGRRAYAFPLHFFPNPKWSWGASFAARVLNAYRSPVVSYVLT